MTDITIRWAGPSDAAAGSTYKIERTLDNATWSELAASQAATAPYASPSSTLTGDVAYGATAINLLNATSISNSGYGWLDGEALVQWTGKSSNQLTGVVWHSGSGTYTATSVLVEAHESYADSGVTITNNAALYRITHTVGGVSSAPAYLWYFAPPAPASADHCVVIVNVATDLGIEARAAISVTCEFAVDTQYAGASGAHLDAGKAAAKSANTNAFGLAFFQCWRNSARGGLGSGVDAAYTFTLDVSTVVAVATVPDRDWVLLKDIGA